jgi:hypothetical protein
MTPDELAGELEISGKTLRAWLRRTYPRHDVDESTRWLLTHDQIAAARNRWSRQPREKKAGGAPAKQGARARGRSHSDEFYVVDLCDAVLHETARRQHRFDWLVGDTGTSGRSARLPVDAYYPANRLVVEYRERQHEESVPFFDKVHRLTVSGVHRGEQRRRYDERRAREIPLHDLRYVVINWSDLDADSRGRLKRNATSDTQVIRSLLK